MAIDADNIRLLGFSGSLRKASYSAAVLRSLKERVGDRVPIEIFPLDSIPLYNADVEDAGLPDIVSQFKTAIAECDGIVISTPEYNYGISGVLKNAIDWASRPGYESVLKNKPVLMISSSPSFTGGVRAIQQLRQTLSACLSKVVAVPEIVIGGVGSKIEDGRLTDETSMKYAARGVDALLAEIKLQRSQG